MMIMFNMFSTNAIDKAADTVMTVSRRSTETVEVR